MTYSLEFKESAFKEWQKLDGAIRGQFKKKLAERLERPHVASARLSGMTDCYKIKLKNAGYRLVYQVDDKRVVKSDRALRSCKLGLNTDQLHLSQKQQRRTISRFLN